MTGPNPARVLLSILRARRLRPPDPRGSGTLDHAEFEPVLAAVASGGIAALGARAGELSSYVKRLSDVDPDTLTSGHALAFWINLYNAAALDLARRTAAAGHATVLRVRGAFDRTFAVIAGESLSLDGVEHGKIRRFADPRVHAALVCGSASCPTLRPIPYSGDAVDDELDDRMRSFLRIGGAEADRERAVLRLSRVLLWYGADFTRPNRMPTILPTTKTALREAVTPWLPEDMVTWVGATAPKVEFMAYDWALGCSVR